jgi:hypothetical protein
MTKTSSRNGLKKKLEEGRRRNRIETGIDLYKKPLITYLITVFTDGSIKADKVTPQGEGREGGGGEEEDEDKSL